MRPIGNQNTAINDRFFISNAMGYTHLGHSYSSSMPHDDQKGALNEVQLSTESDNE